MDVSPSDGGTIKVDETPPSSYPFTSTLENGSSVQLEAVPAPGYHFSNWSGDLSGSTNPTSLVIECNKEITANFSQKEHTLLIRVIGNGSTTPTVGNHSYIEGYVVDITATPDDGWQFDGWTGDATEPASVSITVTMDSDKRLTANFAEIKHPWWLIGGIIAGVIIIAAIVWFFARRRTSSYTA